VSSEPALRDVSDTALWVAVHRAVETERRRPLFRDPYARLLAGERGEQIARELRRSGDSWPVVVRTAVLDELILRALRRDGVRCVLNLAAGLDSRPYRLDLPADLRWVEADLPGVLAHKERLLAGERPRCRLERVALDLFDADSRQRLLDQAIGAPTLVVSEGLLVYLAREDVQALARDLAARPDFRWWLLDLAGPLFLEWSRRLAGDELSAAGASMRFAPEDGADFFCDLGWEPVDVRSSWDEARRLGREPLLMRVAWVTSSRARRESYRSISRYVLLEQRK
jgi:methyltransferase (TIGR00027 family)